MRVRSMRTMGRPFDRRGFLIDSSSLALAGAMSLAASGAETEPPPGKPLRVAVVCTGARGSDLIRALTTIEAARIVAVCDDYPPHLERGAKYAGPEA